MPCSTTRISVQLTIAGMNDNNFSRDDDNIDLLLLIERAIGFFKKYRRLFIIALVMGCSVGFTIYRSIPDTFTSRMVIRPFQLANQEEILIINNWNELLTKKEHATLATILNCDKKILRRVKKIRADEVQKVFSGTNPYGFFVDVIVADNEVLPELQKGIVYGLENSPFVKEKIAIRKSNLQILIAQTNSEIKKLDSIKNAITGIVTGKAKPSSSIILDGFSVNRQMIDIREKLLNYEEALQFADAIQVLQGFSQIQKPVRPNFIFWTGAGCIFFLAIAYVIALVHSVNEKLKARKQANGIYITPEQKVNELRIFK